MDKFIYHMPVKVYFEENGVEKYLADALSKYGRKIMVAYGGGSVVRNGILDEVLTAVKRAGREAVLFGGIPSNPTYEKILEGIELYRKEEADLILAVGGGSVVDSVKIMAAGAVCEKDLWELEVNEGAKPETFAPYAVVLTISGAGAEMDHLGACTYEKIHEKRTLVSTYADFVIEDPRYIMQVPLKLFTPGVFDSLCHCMESYFGKGYNVWDEMNEGLMRNIVANGKALMENPDSMEVRSNLMWDSSLIQSFSFYMGKSGDFTAHRIENTLAAYTHRTHGVELGIVIPVYYTHVYQDDLDKFAKFAERVMGVSAAGKDQKTIAEEGIAKLKEFVRVLNLPSTFEEAGIEVTEEIIQNTAEKCPIPVTGPRPLTRNEITDILRECMK